MKLRSDRNHLLYGIYAAAFTHKHTMHNCLPPLLKCYFVGNFDCLLLWVVEVVAVGCAHWAEEMSRKLNSKSQVKLSVPLSLLKGNNNNENGKRRNNR